MDILDKLIDFARDHHEAFEPFSDDTIRSFFVRYKQTTKVRFDAKGDITGFAVWQELPDKIIFIAIAGVGDRRENYREMMKHLRRFKKPFFLRSEKGHKCLLRQVPHY